MSDIAIYAEGIGKTFHINGPQSRFRYTTLRDSLGSLALAPARAIRSLVRGNGKQADDEPFWALRDVSFEVKRGDVVGIIGRNGSGKSTLLKILSRITEPTTGRAEVHGRGGSLLEVGTGFHPELSGRENIFLNGAILGMKRPEIARKFDEIVAFSEVEQFVDTPVKHYSSGMYLRLAFAVAAHLEPEILLVDEVLAVGDAAFQKKCLGKMGEVAKGGRTVLFVSHNMAAIENLCQHGLVLNRGKVEYAGNQVDAISHYLRSFETEAVALEDHPDRLGSGEIRIVNIDFRDEYGNLVNHAMSGHDIEIHLHYEAQPGFFDSALRVALAFRTPFDVPLFIQHSRLSRHVFGRLPQTGTFVCRIPRLPLVPHDYRISYTVHGYGYRVIDKIEHACELSVTSGDFFGGGDLPPVTYGNFLVDGSWRLDS